MPDYLRKKTKSAYVACPCCAALLALALCLVPAAAPVTADAGQGTAESKTWAEAPIR